MTTPDQRLTHLEAAFISLCERVIVLERALAFEVEQREFFEGMVGRLTGLPGRMDHVEAETIKLRRMPHGRRNPA